MSHVYNDLSAKLMLENLAAHHSTRLKANDLVSIFDESGVNGKRLANLHARLDLDVCLGRNFKVSSPVMYLQVVETGLVYTIENKRHDPGRRQRQKLTLGVYK